MESALTLTLSARVYIAKLELHPMLLHLTYVPSSQQDRIPLHVPRLGPIPIIDILKNSVALANARISINSFTVDEVLETPNNLKSVIGAHYIRQAARQILSLATSMTMLGNPANLASNIGGGVKDFFYEPAQGLVRSPKEFVKGIGKGTSSLVRNVVSGTLSVAVGIGDNVTRNLALLAAG